MDRVFGVNADTYWRYRYERLKASASRDAIDHARVVTEVRNLNERIKYLKQQKEALRESISLGNTKDESVVESSADDSDDSDWLSVRSPYDDSTSNIIVDFEDRLDDRDDYGSLKFSSDEELKKYQKKKAVLEYEMNQLSKKIDELTLKYTLAKDVVELKKQYAFMDESIMMSELGFYEPIFDFTTSVEYKEKLKAIRQTEKNLAKSFKAVKFLEKLYYDNDEKKGLKLQKEAAKQLIRQFNMECDNIIDKVTVNNFDRMSKRLSASYIQLNKFNIDMNIEISIKYKKLKLNEMHLALEYKEMKEYEKDKLREQREAEKEERKAKKELAIKEKQLAVEVKAKVKERSLLKEAYQKLQAANDKEAANMKRQIDLLTQQLNAKQSEADKVRRSTINTNAGYVYIISNIGAFGENIVKIGVTRRSDPNERIRELSGASVPFKFDTHALIYSNEAYKLESELHNKFDVRRVNKVNKRKEFFKLTPDEIERFINYYSKRHPDDDITFYKTAEANEYRQTLALTRRGSLKVVS